MSLYELLNLSVQKNASSNEPIEIKIPASISMQVYPFSINTIEDGVVFVAKVGIEKFLFILVNANSMNLL